MDKKAILLEVLHNATGETEYPIETLMHPTRPASAEFVAQRIARQSANFCAKISLQGWIRLYEAGLDCPIAIQAAIGHAKGLEFAGYTFSTPYRKAIIALKRAVKGKQYAYDPELQALIERAAQELAPVPDSCGSPLDQFDMDRP